MVEVKRQLKEDAEKKYGKIYPVGQRKSLDDCFTEEEKQIIFWFNLDDQSTRILAKRIIN